MKVYRRDGIEFLEIKDYKQVGRFMEVATIECSIKSPYPISFQIGDYVIFDYNGLQYSLYEIPVVKKQARSGSYGEAFVYDLKFIADTEQLVLCPFLDIVENDNNIHFTSLPNFSTFENVYGIVSRIQANMDYLYPGKWSIRVAETDDEELQDILSDAREFSSSKNSCFDSCKKIFDIWGVSYIHTFEDGINTITFGKSAGVTSKFRYGKGQGLRALKKNVQNTDELCTRLYAYGSTRNLPARWYNDKGYIGESQYVPNLMLPPSLWHDNKPQGAYIDAVFEKNYGDVVLVDDRIEQYGLRIKSFYYDGSENREEIYPSIEKLTAKNIRDAKADIGDTEYIPSTTLYPDSDRMDYILEGSSISDNGVLEAASDKLYSEKINIPIEEIETLYRHSTIPMSNGDYNLFNTKRTWRICSFDISSVAKYRIDKIDNFIYLIKNDKYSTITTNYYIENPLGKRVLLYSVKCEPETLSKSLQMPQVIFSADNIGTYSIIVEYSIVWPDDTSGLRPITSSALGDGFIFSFWMPTTTLVISKGELILSTFFTVKIKQIGFDLNDVTASNGAIKTISFKSGMCGGRSFEISSCERSVDDDSWILTCRRSDDSEVSQRFPNKIFPISAGDQFVLVNINMPDLYVWTAMYRLYDAAYADLLHYSRPQYLIEPEVDKIQIAKSQQLLREGMYMPIEDDDLRFNEDVLIDSVTINNKGTELRTFEVTLRNDKSLNRLSKLSDRVSSLESSTTQSEQDSTRTPAKDEFTLENMYDVSQRLSLLEDVIGIDSNKDVFIKEKENGTPRNFYSFGEITAGGVGEGGSSSSGAAYNRLDTWENYNENAGDVLSAKLGYDLKQQIEQLQQSGGSGESVVANITVKIGDAEYTAVDGVVSLPAYPIMPDVPTLVSELQNDAGYITNAALVGYATQSWVQQQKYLTSIPSEYITATGLSSILVNYQSKITSSNKLDYSLLENTPTIPSAVTESTVSGWGFTKNAGTVTEVKMNGASKTPTNGVIDLGSVITAHQDLSNYATLSDIEPLDERLTIIESTYLDSITQQMVIDALDYTPFDSASFTKANIKSALGIADWALASSKPSYSWDEITSRPTLLSQFTDDIVAGKYLPLTGGVLSGALSVPNINITSAAAVAHLAFGRQGGNFITAPAGGYLAFIPGGKSVATANADLVITDGHVYPGTTGYTRLGFGDKRWSQVSSVDGDFSGALTAGTFRTSSVVACGGRLRINASNSASSFGFLKATAYSSALNVGVLDIGSNYGGSSNITSEAVDVVAMSMYRGAVGVGRAFTYDELYANRASNVMLSVEGNINNVGDIVSTGEQVAGSDMRYKIVKSKFRLSSAIIAQAPLFRFKWKNHKTTKLKIGTSAQYWEEFAPELVTFDSVSDFKHLNYAGLGVAIGISNAREIEQLKKEIVSLKERLSKYEHN